MFAPPDSGDHQGQAAHDPEEYLESAENFVLHGLRFEGIPAAEQFLVVGMESLASGDEFAEFGLRRF